ncbi:MAG: Na+/H+ antiporter subunit C [Paracoccus sp. (in: a-proteobacteria)]|uniref:Na+/H+ antiporter subunit C n=1 Tax=Paracoccus sp. TaxID=267 RepID=UPI0039E30FE7
MELLLSSAIGMLTGAGIYLILRRRSFAVVLGTTMLSYAINLFLFSTGRLVVDAPPILREGAARYTDPLPQALVLTAIVISFGMTAVTVMMALGAFLEGGDDRVDMPRADRRAEEGPQEGPQE